MELTEKLKDEFSRRLCGIAMENGYVTEKGKIDFERLSEATGCSTQMMRRYLSGGALPSTPVIQNISDLFKVDPYWLIYGASGNNLNLDLFKRIFFKMREFLITNANVETIFNKYVTICFEIYERSSKLQTSAEDIEKMLEWMISSAKSIAELQELKDAKVTTMLQGVENVENYS